MANGLSQQRCLNHLGREAVACCPECKRFFCRECITEHDDRIICASCIAKLSQKKGTKSRWFHDILITTSCLLSFVFLWLVYYSLGRVLISIPTYFQDGTAAQLFETTR
jgi:hypothetical protein